MKDKNWIQDVNEGMEERGTVGSFTKQAKRADMSVKDFAEDVKMNPEKFTKRTRQRANLAQTFEGMNNKKTNKMAQGGKTTQGFNDKLNESLGMRTGEGTSTEQSYKDRRDESKGANRNLGRRAYSSVDTMDEGNRMFEKGGKTQGYDDRDRESIGERNKGVKSQSLDSRMKESAGTEKSMGRRKYADVSTMDEGDRMFAKGGTLTEKAVKKNYIRRDRYDKLKKEKDAKIDELKDANKDKVADLKKDLKDKGADCYDDIKQTKKDIGKTVAKRIDQIEKQKSEDCDNKLDEFEAIEEELGERTRETLKEQKTESLMLGGLGGLLLGFFLSR